MSRSPKGVWSARQSQDSQGIVDETLIHELQRDFNLGLVLANLVAKRLGGDRNRIERFLQPTLRQMSDPALLPDIGAAVERLVAAIHAGETIGVHGDYDVDGVAATSLLTRFLRAFGAKRVLPFVPERDQDGYGLSRRGLEWMRNEGVRLVVSCDCGITAVEEAAFAASLGLDLIITDHHLPSESLPQAIAVVNPNRRDSKFPFREVCGTAVAFYVLVALRSALRIKLGRDDLADLRDGLDLVALATVADVMPLLEDNRIFVRNGLRTLRQSKWPGINALIEQAGVEGQDLSATDLSFKLIPRLNSAGRMRKASLGVDLLLTDDPVAARRLAAEIEDLNQQRRDIEASVRASAMDQVGSFDASSAAVVVSGEGWHEGVLGIVAARLAEQVGRTVAVIAWEGDRGVGSVRGSGQVNVVSALQAAAPHLVRFGGHAAAAGLTLLREAYSKFEAAFQTALRTQMSQQGAEDTVAFDADLPLTEATAQFVNALAILEPCGEGNPEPIFRSNGLQLESPRIVGEKHLKCRLGTSETSMAAIGFGLASWITGIEGKAPSRVDVLHTPRWNDFRGERTIQLQIRALRVPEKES